MVATESQAAALASYFAARPEPPDATKVLRDGVELREVGVEGQEGTRLVRYDPRAPEGSREEVLVDATEFDDSGRSWVSRWNLSPDERYLDFQVTDPHEHSVLRVLDLTTGQLVGAPIDRCRNSPIAWHSDSKGFYYTRVAEPFDIYEQSLHHWSMPTASGNGPEATPVSTDIALPPPPSRAASYIVPVTLTKDGRWLLVCRSDGCSPASQYFIADLHEGDPAAPTMRSVSTRIPQDIWARQPFEHDGQFYLVAQDRRDRGAVYRVPPEQFHNRDAWEEVVGEPANRREILGAKVTVAKVDGESRIIVHRIEDGASSYTVHTMDGTQVHEIQPPPGIRYAAALSSSTANGLLKVTWDAPGYRETVEHSLKPGDVPESWGSEAEQEAARERRRGDVEVHKIYFQPAGNVGKGVIWISRLRGTKGVAPTILRGYGFNGMPEGMESMSPELTDAWRRAGGIWACATFPGGGTYGDAWGKARDGEQRELSPKDWAAAATALYEAGLATPKTLVALARSSPGGVVLQALRKFPKVIRNAAVFNGIFDYSVTGARYLPVDPERPDCSGYWTMGDLAGTQLSTLPNDAVRLPAGAKLVIAYGEKDTRCNPDLHSKRLVAMLKSIGQKGLTVVRSWKDGHAFDTSSAEYRIAAFRAVAAMVGVEFRPAPGSAPGAAPRSVAQSASASALAPVRRFQTWLTPARSDPYRSSPPSGRASAERTLGLRLGVGLRRY